MARFWTLSDLHQEHGENRFVPRRPTEPFDAIVAAGDVCGTLPDAVAWLRGAFPHDRVLYVAGNHDYWQWPTAEGRLTLWQVLDAGREAALRHDVDFLSDDEVTVAGARVCGCTLWTDYRVDGLGAAYAMRVAERRMNDYGRIRRPSSTRPTRSVRPTSCPRTGRASLSSTRDWRCRSTGPPWSSPTMRPTRGAWSVGSTS